MSTCDESTAAVPVPVIAKSCTKQIENGFERMLADTVDPTLDHLLSAAGLQLTPQQIDELKRAFVERGSINIRPGGANMEASLNVEVTSLTYNSKVLQAQQP